MKSMINQKTLWEKLAKENPRYYINSDKGRGITEQEFRESSESTYKRHIANDKLIWGKQTILDYGCGIGRLTEFMARDFKKVIGVDISAAMIAAGRQRLKELENVEFLETDGKRVQLLDASVDLVFSYKEICRVLKQKGIFKVLLRSDKQKDMNRWWSGVEYSQEAIGMVYKKIGFRLLKIEPIDKYTFWLWIQT